MIKLLSFGLLLISTSVFAAQSSPPISQPSYAIEITLPVIKQGQYHRPYIALRLGSENFSAQSSVFCELEYTQKAQVIAVNTDLTFEEQQYS